VVRHGEKGRQGDEDDDGPRQALLPEIPHPAEEVLRGFVPGAGAADQGHVHQEQAKRTARKLAPLMKKAPATPETAMSTPATAGPRTRAAWNARS